MIWEKRRIWLPPLKVPQPAFDKMFFPPKQENGQKFPPPSSLGGGDTMTLAKYSESKSLTQNKFSRDQFWQAMEELFRRHNSTQMAQPPKFLLKKLLL